jgi:hypothetical protein
MEARGPVSTPEYRVSAKLVAAVRLHSLRAYEIAHRCGLNPSTLSKLVNGIDWVMLGDERVLRLAAFLGVPRTEAFEAAHASENQAPSDARTSRPVPEGLEERDGP